MSAFEFPKKVEYQQSSLSETFFISNSSYESLTALWLRLDSGLESGGETCLSQRAWPLSSYRKSISQFKFKIQHSRIRNFKKNIMVFGVFIFAISCG